MYMYKGLDRAAVQLQVPAAAAAETAPQPAAQQQSASGDQPVVYDKISTFIDEHCISTSECRWWLLQYDIHRRSPNVIQLAVHLSNQQAVTFREDNSLAAVASRAVPTTTLTAWFKAKHDYTDAAVLYQDLPSW